MAGSTAISVSLHGLLKVVHAFLVEKSLIGAARALELETGVHVFDANDTDDDSTLLRELVLDGRWDDVETICVPLSSAKGFDSTSVLFEIRRQRLLELIAASLNPSSTGTVATHARSSSGPDGDSTAVVEVLRSLEPVCPSRVAFNSLCYALTLPSVQAHPEHSDWTPALGRWRTLQAVQREFHKVFPPSSAAGSSAVPAGTLERLMGQAAAAQALARCLADPRLLPLLSAQGGGAGAGTGAHAGAGAAAAMSSTGAGHVYEFDPSRSSGLVLPSPSAGLHFAGEGGSGRRPGTGHGRAGSASAPGFSSILTTAQALPEVTQRLLSCNVHSQPLSYPIPLAPGQKPPHTNSSGGLDAAESRKGHGGRTGGSKGPTGLLSSTLSAAQLRGVLRTSQGRSPGPAAATLDRGTGGGGGGVASGPQHRPVTAAARVSATAHDHKVQALTADGYARMTGELSAALATVGSAGRMEDSQVDGRPGTASSMLATLSSDGAAALQGILSRTLGAAADVPLPAAPRPRPGTPPRGGSLSGGADRRPSTAAASLLPRPKTAAGGSEPGSAAPTTAASRRSSGASLSLGSQQMASLLQQQKPEGGRPGPARPRPRTASGLDSSQPTSSARPLQGETQAQGSAGEQGKRPPVAWEVPVYGLPSAPVSHEGEVLSETLGPYHKGKPRQGSLASASATAGLGGFPASSAGLTASRRSSVASKMNDSTTLSAPASGAAGAPAASTLPNSNTPAAEALRQLQESAVAAADAASLAVKLAMDVEREYAAAGSDADEEDGFESSKAQQAHVQQEASVADLTLSDADLSLSRLAEAELALSPPQLRAVGGQLSPAGREASYRLPPQPSGGISSMVGAGHARQSPTRPTVSPHRKGGSPATPSPGRPHPAASTAAASAAAAGLPSLPASPGNPLGASRLDRTALLSQSALNSSMAVPLPFTAPRAVSGAPSLFSPNVGLGDSSARAGAAADGPLLVPALNSTAGGAILSPIRPAVLPSPYRPPVRMVQPYHPSASVLEAPYPASTAATLDGAQAAAAASASAAATVQYMSQSRTGALSPGRRASLSSPPLSASIVLAGGRAAGSRLSEADLQPAALPSPLPVPVLTAAGQQGQTGLARGMPSIPLTSTPPRRPGADSSAAGRFTSSVNVSSSVAPLAQQQQGQQQQQSGITGSTDTHQPMPSQYASTALAGAPSLSPTRSRTVTGPFFAPIPAQAGQPEKPARLVRPPQPGHTVPALTADRTAASQQAVQSQTARSMPSQGPLGSRVYAPSEGKEEGVEEREDEEEGKRDTSTTGEEEEDDMVSAGARIILDAASLDRSLADALAQEPPSAAPVLSVVPAAAPARGVSDSLVARPAAVQPPAASASAAAGKHEAHALLASSLAPGAKGRPGLGGVRTMPGWLAHTLREQGLGTDESGCWLSSGGSLPALSMNPFAVFKDTEPIRALAWEAHGRDSLGLLAVGTNSKALHVCGVPQAAAAEALSRSELPAPSRWSSTLRSGTRLGDSLAAPSGRHHVEPSEPETGLPLLPGHHVWQGHHTGSVYCIDWARAQEEEEAGGGAAAAQTHSQNLLATGSNDMTVRVCRFASASSGDAEDAGESLVDGAVGTASLIIPAEMGTVRTVAWLGSWSSTSSSCPLLAAGGGGDHCVRVWDVSPFAQATPLPSLCGPNPVQVRPPRAPLAVLSGHTGVVHAVRPWGSDGRQLITASADGTCRLWDTRAPRGSALTLCLTTAQGQLATAGTALSSFAPQATASIELHSLCVRPSARDVAVGTKAGQIAVVDVKAGRLVASSAAHKDEIRSMDALGPLLLSASFDGTINLSAATASSTSGDGVPSLVTLASRSDHVDKTLCVRWHPSLPMLASSSADRTAMLWSLQG